MSIYSLYSHIYYAKITKVMKKVNTTQLMVTLDAQPSTKIGYFRCSIYLIPIPTTGGINKLLPHGIF